KDTGCTFPILTAAIATDVMSRLIVEKQETEARARETSAYCICQPHRNARQWMTTHHLQVSASGWGETGVENRCVETTSISVNAALRLTACKDFEGRQAGVCTARDAPRAFFQAERWCWFSSSSEHE